MPDNPKSPRKLTLAVFILALLILLSLQSLGLPRWSSGYLATQTARALILTGSTDTSKLSAITPSSENENLALTRFGPGYLSVSPGQILTMLPFSALGECAQLVFQYSQPDLFALKFCSLASLLFAAGSLALLFSLLLNLGFTIRVSLATTALYAFSTIFFTYALGSECSETLLAFAFLASFYCLTRYAKNETRWWLLGSSLLSAYLLSLKPYAPIFIIPLVLYLFLVAPAPWRRTWRDLTLFLLPNIIALLGIFFFNYLRFHSLWGNLIPADLWGSGDVSDGLYGLLLSPGAGLFLYSPALILSLLGLRRFFYLYRREAIFSLTGLALLLVLFTPCWFWSGDFIWGSRYLLTTVAPLMIPCACFLAKLSKRVKYTSVIIFLIVGFLVGLPSWLVSLTSAPELIPSYALLGHYPECSPMALKWQAVGVQWAKLWHTPPGYLEVYDWHRTSRFGLEQFAEKNMVRPWALKVLTSPNAKPVTKLAVSLAEICLLAGIAFTIVTVNKKIRNVMKAQRKKG
jgi:hypothetical protein